MKTRSEVQDERGFVGFDFDGTIISEEVAHEANRRWFSHMAEVLGDPSVTSLADCEYQRPVLEIMARLHGKRTLTDEERVRYLGEAMDSYIVLVLEIIATTPCANEGVVSVLRDLHKKGYRAALIPSGTDLLVEPALAILCLRQHFDVILTGTRGIVVEKRVLLEEFMRAHGALLCYVGNSNEDCVACAALSTPFVHVRPGEFHFSFRLLSKP